EARRLLAGENLSPGTVRLTSVAQLLSQPLVAARGVSVFETKSKGFALALEALQRQEEIDLIEFPEYAGVAFATLRRRLQPSNLGAVPVAIRIHGAMELIDQVEGVQNADRDRLQMYRMERVALQLADYVLTPSKSIGEFYRAAYGLGDKLLLSA